MVKGNVLLVGVSGSGKSTLVNSIVGEKAAMVVEGDAATKKICPFESDFLDFKLFDTRGFEFNLFSQFKTIVEMKKQIKNGLKEANNDNDNNTINCIWYCVDATVGRLHKESINSLKAIISDMKDVPVIVVLTKSYSVPNNGNNVAMVKRQFAKYGKKIKVAGIIPVVAAPYQFTDEDFVGQYGIEELKEKTNEVLEIFDTAEAKERFRKKQRKYKAQLYINAASVGAATVAAVPIPIPDGIILTPLETAMISKIGKIYGIKKEGDSSGSISEIFELLLAAGTVGEIARMGVNAVKAIPGLTLGASVVNSIIAVSVVELLGQTSIVLFEKIEAGEIDTTKIEDVKNFVDMYVNKNIPKIVESITEFAKGGSGKFDIKQLVGIIFSKFRKDEDKTNE